MVARRFLPAVAAPLLVAAMLGACTYPQDPRGTSDRASGGKIRVGVTENPPFIEVAGTREDPQVTGVEATIIERFAREIDAEVEWHVGSEEEIVGALGYDELDLVAGGITTRNPYRKHTAVTRPYAKTKLVLARPRDDAASFPDDIDGRRIGYDATEIEVAGIIAHNGGRPVPLEAFPPQEGLVVLDDFEAAAHDMRIGEALHTSRHVLLASKGENRFISRLERFLDRNKREIRSELEEAAA